MPADKLGAAKEDLVELACRLTGFSRQALEVGLVERFMERMELAGLTAHELRVRALAGDPGLRQELCRSVCNGETYFFRHPEHFQFLKEHWLPGLPPGALRIWSAGCSSGEEAYSLAAFLDEERPGSDFSILGTDLCPSFVEEARRGRYRAWSFRESGPRLYPVVEVSAPGDLRVRPALQARVRFAGHNIMEEAPEGGFDLVFCRNLLVYLTEEAARRALGGILAAMNPLGWLVLGTVDIAFKPEGLARVQPAEFQIFRKAAPAKPAMANLGRLLDEFRQSARRTPRTL